ncbi:MAG: hypothetical protein Q4G34_10605, partial [Micrococcus sp.]|nr:hypothetical protein [Micrococcus sp.]
PTATQSASPTDSALPTTTASPTASATADAGGAVDVDEEALDRLEVVLLTPQTAPDGVFTDVEVQRLPLETLETSLTLTGVNPTGECADLIERINTQVVPGAGAVLAEYTVDAQHATGFRTNPPEVFTMLAASQDDEDISEIVGHLPEVCGSFGGDQTGWVEMTPIPGVEGAARVAMSMVEGGDVMIDMVLGGESDGTEHVYMGMINVDPDAAAEVMLAQVEAFRDRER